MLRRSGRLTRDSLPSRPYRGPCTVPVECGVLPHLFPIGAQRGLGRLEAGAVTIRPLHPQAIRWPKVLEVIIVLRVDLARMVLAPVEFLFRGADSRCGGMTRRPTSDRADHRSRCRADRTRNRSGRCARQGPSGSAHANTGRMVESGIRQSIDVTFFICWVVVRDHGRKVGSKDSSQGECQASASSISARFILSIRKPRTREPAQCSIAAQRPASMPNAKARPTDTHGCSFTNRVID